jgi:hypothetical protein
MAFWLRLLNGYHEIPKQRTTSRSISKNPSYIVGTDPYEGAELEVELRCS